MKTKWIKKRFVRISSIIILCSGIGYTYESALLLNSQIFLGGYAFNGETTSLGGKLNLNIIPAMKLNNNLTILPVYYLEYNGTKDVKELLGGGTLIQQSLTNTFYVKPIFQLNDEMKFKPKIGVTSQLIRETNDESWGNGLFDYYKANISADLDLSKRTSLGVGVFYVNFYNYKSLASNTTAYGAEIPTGEDVLNFVGYEFSVSKKIWGSNISLYNVYKSFQDQALINELGQYSVDNKRNDNYTMLNVSINKPIIPVGETTVNTNYVFSASYNSSNQNHFDVEKTRGFKDYYNYYEIGLNPKIIFGFNSLPMNLSFDYNIIYRNYQSRVVQDSSGNYPDSNEKIYTLSNYLNMTLSFPISEGLQGFIQNNIFFTSSNMKYEQVYSYNYNAFNLFFGVSYER